MTQLRIKELLGRANLILDKGFHFLPGFVMVKSSEMEAILDRIDASIPEDIKEDLVDMIDLYVYYTRCFLLCARACYACWKFEKTHDRVDRERVLSVLAEVAAYAPVLRARVQKRSYTHEVPRLLDCERLRHLYVNINEHMKRVEEEDGREGGA